jgi:hypothetical protein
MSGYINLREHCRCGHSRAEHSSSDASVVASNYLGLCEHNRTSGGHRYGPCDGFRPFDEKFEKPVPKPAAPSAPMQVCHRCGKADGVHDCSTSDKRRSSYDGTRDDDY